MLHVIRGLNEASRLVLDTRLEVKYGDMAAHMTKDEALRLVKYDDLRTALRKEAVTAAVERAPAPGPSKSTPKAPAKSCYVGLVGPSSNSITPRLDVAQDTEEHVNRLESQLSQVLVATAGGHLAFRNEMVEQPENYLMALATYLDILREKQGECGKRVLDNVEEEAVDRMCAVMAHLPDPELR